MLNFISKFYRKLTSIGITDELTFSEKLRIELNNLFLGIALPCLIVHLIYVTLGPRQFSSYLITISWIILLLVPLFLNHRKQYFAAKVYTIIAPVTGIAIVHLLHGWTIRIEPTYLMMVLMCTFFFKRKLTIVMSAYVFLSFVVVAYLLFDGYDPPLAKTLLPTVPFFYFLFSVITSIVLVGKVLIENQKFNQLVISQNETLAKKNKQLEKFTYIASHDLKTPIRNVTSFSSLIERDLKREQFHLIPDHLAFIKSSALQMSALIEDILQISTLDYADSEVRTLVNLDEIVTQVEHVLLMEEKDTKPLLLNRGLPAYYCNASEMYLVFQNLVQNGFKYNKSEQPTVEIWAQENNNKLLIHCKDNGIGIESAYHEQIFDFFKRLHPTTQYEGTGLGLGLCRRIIEGYNGHIHLESSPGHGSTFTVTLPLKPEMSGKS